MITLDELIEQALEGVAPTGEQLGELQYATGSDRYTSARARAQGRTSCERYLTALATEARTAEPDAVAEKAMEVRARLSGCVADAEDPASLAKQIDRTPTSGASYVKGRPRYSPAEVERQQKQAADSWETAGDDPAELASAALGWRGRR